ncbi:hypothetical protein ABLE91_18710 [Aquabacter sp. CN5-332]|uniref:hypothetical protein n=1 Tax=Aquabacter sp. CN5-332 TaxID=3156608 RepID=UPI0032B3B790
MAKHNDDDAAIAIFEDICGHARAELQRHGKEGTFEGDFWILQSYWGEPQVRLSIQNLDLLRPHVVHALRAIVKKFPGWEIVVVVEVDEHLDDWPSMGLYIRSHEIIDGLQRQYFPLELQNIEYDGARRGTEMD